MNSIELLQKASQKGFGTACVIRPAHKPDVSIFIPRQAQMKVCSNGNLVYELEKGTSFKQQGTSNNWTGLIYEEANARWAVIVEHHSVFNIGPALRDFPEEGVCWDTDKALVKFIEKKLDCTLIVTNSTRGIAWSKNSAWTVSTSSSKPEYDIRQLLPFFENKTMVPMTPDECTFPEKWCIEVHKENKDILTEFYRDHVCEYEGCLSNWEVGIGGYFHYPQQRKGCHTSTEELLRQGYTQITTQQFKTHVLTHTDKQKQNLIKQQENEREFIKVPRADLTVRESDPIRAVGIRCSKIQIKVGSGHLPD